MSEIHVMMFSVLSSRYELVELGVNPEEEGDFAEFGDASLNSSQVEEVPSILILHAHFPLIR